MTIRSQVLIMTNDKDDFLDSKEEKEAIKGFLKRVDENFYHPLIKNRAKMRYEGQKIFPHLGETAKLFENTFWYVDLFKKTGKENKNNNGKK